MILLFLIPQPEDRSATVYLLLILLFTSPVKNIASPIFATVPRLSRALGTPGTNAHCQVLP